MQIPDTYRAKLLPRPELSVKSFLALIYLPNAIPGPCQLRRNNLPLLLLLPIHCASWLGSSQAWNLWWMPQILSVGLCLMMHSLSQILITKDLAYQYGQYSIGLKCHQALAMRALWQGNLDWLWHAWWWIGCTKELWSRLFTSASAAVVCLNAHTRTPREYTTSFTRRNQLHQRGRIDEDAFRQNAHKVPGGTRWSTSYLLMFGATLYCRQKYESSNLTFITEIERRMTRNYWQKKISTLPAPARGEIEGSDKCLEFQSTWLQTNTSMPLRLITRRRNFVTVSAPFKIIADRGSDKM